jgi:hypothetical protein
MRPAAAANPIATADAGAAFNPTALKSKPGFDLCVENLTFRHGMTKADDG